MKLINSSLSVLKYFVYLMLFVSLFYLLQGCALGGLDLTDNRELTIKESQASTEVTIKGDIIGVEDYIALHSLIRVIRESRDQRLQKRVDLNLTKDNQL